MCKPSTKKITYWDTATTGFILEMRPNGATFALRYIDKHGSQRQLKIAALHEITFAEAEKKAKRLRSEIVLGGCPATSKEKIKSIPTYAELAALHCAHSKTHMKSYNSLETIMRVHVLPRWGKKRLNEITAQDVGKWLAEKSDEGLRLATVEKIRVTFGRSFELGRRWGVPGSEVNPTRGIDRPKYDNRRQRFLSSEEAGRLLAAASNSLNVQLRPLVELLLQTGARLSELTHAKWADIDLESRSWHIPITKTSKARFVPLAQAAIDIIEQLPRFEGCPWLIPNPETGNPFVTVKHSWQKARRDAHLPGLRLHDLRHTAASQMANSGVPLFTIATLLGHSDLKSSSR